MNQRIRLVSIFLAPALLLPALAQAGGTVPEGAKISVVIDQAVSSKTAKIGQTVTGTVSQDVASGGKVVIPKGSAAKLTVSSVQASGRLSTPAKLYLRLRAVTVGGKTYTFATNSAGRTEGGKGMPGSSAAERLAARLSERWLEAARAQRSVQRLERESEPPAQRRRGRKTSSFPPKRSWLSPPGHPWRSTDT